MLENIESEAGPGDRIFGLAIFFLTHESGELGAAVHRESRIEEDFTTFVFGAMAERSDGGLIPEYVNYEDILRLAQRLRKSLAQ